MSGSESSACPDNMVKARIARALSIVLLVIFVAVTLIYYFTSWQDVDNQIATTMKDHAKSHPAVRGFFVAITDLGAVTALSMLATAGVLWCCATGQFRLALVWFIATAGGSLLNLGVKTIMNRQRPPLHDRAIAETNESYPSGHAMGSVIGFGMLAFAVFGKLRTRPRQYVFLAMVVALVIVIGVSRIYLRAHWFSDVCAGFALGGAWLALCIFFFLRTKSRGESAS